MLLHDKLASYRLLLASQSPRRRELLSGSGLKFEMAEKFEVEECYPADLAAEEVAPYLSRLKSEGYPHPLSEGEILLTADTVVIAQGKILGKPHSRDEALEMLGLLSGRGHTVVTGVTLRSSRKTETFSSCSEVFFRPISEEEAAYYVDQYRPYDKAGSYGIQEWIGYVAIERIEGSFYNVMGLPIQRVYVELEKFLAAMPQ
ncbi:MAG: septum formation protein Maf [Rikenellaceae bacterium]|nr:septum formation protein Maf [Rikenellaceae bacterium]